MVIKKGTGKTLRSVLFIGVIIAMLIMVIGLFLYSASPQEDDTAIPMKDLITDLAELNPIAILDVGILVLMITPIAGILSVMFNSIRKQEYKFVYISVLVIILIIISFSLSLFR